MSLLVVRAVSMLLVAAAPARRSDPCSVVPAGRVVPGTFIANRYFARWRPRTGEALNLYLDTGGGPNSLYPAAVQRLHMPVDTEIMAPDTVIWTRLARAQGDDSLPAIPIQDGGTMRFYVPRPGGQFAWIMEGFVLDGIPVDGQLGPSWFADRVWTFDYPGRRLLYHGSDAIASVPSGCWIPVGFQVDSAGQRTSNFPRVTALIDGDSLDFLFDAGAMTTLTDSAWHAVDPGQPVHRATSFIVMQLFDRWHARHPEWPVVWKAERGTGSPMIRVPEIGVGGVRLGPVWFTGRADPNFHEFMSQWMDRRIDGALGGTAWQSAAVVLDYPRARLAVLKPASR